MSPANIHRFPGATLARCRKCLEPACRHVVGGRVEFQCHACGQALKGGRVAED